MAYATFKVTPGSAGVDLRENAFAILFLFLSIAAVALRLLVTPEMMNMLMSYSIEGGPFYQKLHLATYAMLAVLFTILVNRLSRPPQLAEEDADVLRSMLRYGAILSAFVVYFVVTSRFSAIGFLIETYLTAVLMVIILLFQSKQARRLVAVAVLCILIASAFVGIVEAILQRHLVSINAGGDFFVPMDFPAIPWRSADNVLSRSALSRSHDGPAGLRSRSFSP
ncbi:hypothetical protein P6U16_22985 (plasmid) [Rhizobium sp. 32-5/1]|uniref:hypothetical protein n=1 Tax=Rhizobium sp. 32-5/1 TaxID=3019602 RepID=UPI00240CFBF8|nr:hypothetical protein [Rhizobium sp. 32-5/1]WEZ85863.1 hypothetical protein P6U16_22985 [Rhizobium sp. 32-5/1]